ncbi:replication fork protection component Swi3-domain-containing protein [Cytidiella melzeri]|nr:replication fork protection component Swi3-domain-containing protein [Cytidiella melzeri]
MSVSIDDIWSTPLENTPPRTRKDVLTSEAIGNTPSRPSPAKRRRTTLFLSSDSENDAPSTSKVPYRIRTPPPSDKDKQKSLVDALFDDLDGDDDGGGFKELAPSLNIEALRKQASQRNGRARIPALTPHQILPSSSPERDLGPDEVAGGVSGKQQNGKEKKKDDEDGMKKRKLLAKLDEVRLIGDGGFPALIKQTKDFKPRGKGHELSDLNRVLGIYQFWTHKMYPKGTFHDNVQRVEKICHSKRMHNYLGMWRDASKGLINGRKPEDLQAVGDPSDDSDSDFDQDQGQSGPSAPAADITRSSSPPTRPPSSASERPSSAAPDDDDFDIDAMIQEEEERQAAQAAPSRPVSHPPAPTQPQPDEDQDMWDQFDDEVVTQPPPPPLRRVQPSMGDDVEDEDMWDLVREIEGDATASKGALAPVSAAPRAFVVETALSGGQPQQSATNEEGWDEMYL